MPATIPRPRSSRRRPASPAAGLAIVGAEVLCPDGVLREAGVRIRDGRIVEVGAGAGPMAQECDARGLLLLPGIVDVHGDAFERAVQPRPGVTLPLGLAMRENDAWLLAAGITTFFCSVTDSFEPGLRGRANLRRIIELFGDSVGHGLSCDTRLHVRHEVCLVEGHEELLRWMDEGRIHMLSTADHLPESDDAAKLDRYRLAAARRLTCDPAALDRMIAVAGRSRVKGRAQEAELAAAARCLGIPLASHDDDAASIAASLDRGVAICAFPRDLATAGRARQGGAQVLMGAPNWLRGGSHLGLLGVAEALADGIVDLLCSDYHYPSLLHAPFLMAQQGLRSLPAAWAMVSAVPAAAAGLLDKGRIAAGYAADLLLVDARDPGLCRLKSVFVAGREVARFA